MIIGKLHRLKIFHPLNNEPDKGEMQPGGVLLVLDHVARSLLARPFLPMGRTVRNIDPQCVCIPCHHQGLGKEILQFAPRSCLPE